MQPSMHRARLLGTLRNLLAHCNQTAQAASTLALRPNVFLCIAENTSGGGAIVRPPTSSRRP